MLCIVGLSHLFQNLSVTLVKYFCLPALLYGIEVTDPSTSVLRMLNNLINRAVYRIFNVSDKDSIIADIRYFVGLHDIELLYKQRLANFVKKEDFYTPAFSATDSSF